MGKKLEAFLVKVIKGEKKGIFAKFLRSILHLLSWGFKCGVSCRNWIFDRKILTQYFPPVPIVISIGNIVVGGTGKTPATLMIAQEFYPDFNLAILSRGYRSKAEKLATPVVLSKGEGPILPALYCGDEPYMLSQNIPKAYVFVGRDRHKSSNMAAKAGAQIILLDDGMQHRRLARDFEVVVIDSLDPFGLGYFLPRGLLRESVKSLSRAHLIILNHVQDLERYAAIKQQIARYSKAPVVGTKMEVVNIFDHEGKEIDSIKGKKVAIFCGISHPEYFQRTIETLGAEIIDHYFIQDHKSFQSDYLERFVLKSFEQGADYVICTEKDRVKIDQAHADSLSIAWIKMKLCLVEGEYHWKDFIKKVKTDLMCRI